MCVGVSVCCMGCVCVCWCFVCACMRTGMNICLQVRGGVGILNKSALAADLFECLYMNINVLAYL